MPYTLAHPIATASSGLSPGDGSARPLRPSRGQHGARHQLLHRPATRRQHRSFLPGPSPTSLVVRGVTEATSGLFLDLLVYGLVNSLSRWTHRH